MKSLHATSLALMSVLLMATHSLVRAQSPPLTSEQIIEGALSNPEHRNELARLDSFLSGVLADQRLTDQGVRQMLTESKAAIAEMLSTKVGTNVPKLVELAKWMKSQLSEKQGVEDSGATPTQPQQFILDNPLAGEEVYLTTIIREVLNAYLRTDRDNAGGDKLEAFMQLYLGFSSILESRWVMADDMVLYAPNWVQPRFLQLTDVQKRQFFKDLQLAQSEKSRPLAADEEAAPPPTPQEQAAYESAFEYIENNTPSD